MNLYVCTYEGAYEGAQVVVRAGTPQSALELARGECSFSGAQDVRAWDVRILRADGYRAVLAAHVHG